MSKKLSPSSEAVPQASWDDGDKVRVEQFIDCNIQLLETRAADHIVVYPFTGILEVAGEDGKFRRVRPQQCAFIAAERRFSLRTTTAFSGLFIHFSPSCLSELSGLTHQDLSYSSHIIEGDAYIFEIFGLIDRELSNRDMHSDVALAALTTYIGLYLLRNYSRVVKFEEAAGSRPNLCLINQALEYIEENFGEEIQIPELASMLGLTMFRFLKSFKDVTGQTPQQYIISRRLEAARRLLHNPDLKLDEIARRTGFGNQSHFTRSFRKHYGTTPSESRRG